jgi:hypothetical protein
LHRYLTQATVAEDEQIQILRNWLQPHPDYQSDLAEYQFVLKDNDDTCGWVFDPSDDAGNTILSWLEGTAHLVWLTGAPAQGKSVAASSIITHCKKQYGNCLYFFCSDREFARQSASSVLRTTAFQWAEANPYVRGHYLSVINRGVTLKGMPVLGLWSKLFEGFSLLPAPIHYVLDGFDELYPDDQKTLASLFNHSSAESNLKIFLLSRPGGDVAKSFESSVVPFRFTSIHHQRTADDIRRVVSRRVETRKPLSDLSGEERTKVVNTLVQTSGGLFLWASLALDVISKLGPAEDILATLKDIPLDNRMDKLSHLYQFIAERLSKKSSNHQKFTKCILMWTTCAARPLTVSELRFVIELQLSANNIRNLEGLIQECTGLLITVDENRRVVSIHHTVKEFFQNELAGEFRVDHEAGQEQIQRFCLDYLCGLPDEFLHKELTSPPMTDHETRYIFLDYSTHYLFHHSEKVVQKREVIAESLMEFLESRRSLTWLEAIALLNKFDLLFDAAAVLSGLAKSCSHDTGAKLRQLAVDLSRIAFLPLPMTQYPRSVHQSFRIIAPDKCLIAREGYAIAKRLSPRRDNWPALITSYGDAAEEPKNEQFRADFAFTPCGNYLIRGLIPTSREFWGVKSSVFQTRTWNTVGNGQTLTSDRFGRHIHEYPFHIACSWSPEEQFRYVVMWAIHTTDDDDPGYATFIYELSGPAPYATLQYNKPPDWEDLGFLDRDAQLALQQAGKGILVWDKERLLIWPSISLKSSSWNHDNIVAAEFVPGSSVNKVVCVDAEGRFYIVNFSGTLWANPDLHDIRVRDPWRAFVDSSTGVILLAIFSENFDHKFSTIEFSDGFKSHSSEIADVRQYSGDMAARNLKYYIWFCHNTRRLVWCDNKIFAHPEKSQCIVPRGVCGGFMVLEDINEDWVRTTFDISNTQTSISPIADSDSTLVSMSHWRDVLARQESLRDRIRLHENTFAASPCRQFVGFTGCNADVHSESPACTCGESSYRMGIGCIDGKIRWIQPDTPGLILLFKFDKSQHLIALRQTESGRHRFEVVHCVSGTLRLKTYDMPLPELKGRTVGVWRTLQSHTVQIVWDSLAGDSVLLSTYTSSMGSNSSQEFDFTKVKAIDKVKAIGLTSSAIVLLVNERWICLQEIKGRKELKHLFLLPQEIAGPLINEISYSGSILTIETSSSRVWELRLNF